MASEVPPNPITTDYNPIAWDEAMTATDRNKALEANYIKLSPQNYPITFLNSISVPISSTSDTRFATTSMINTFWTTFISTYYVWTGLQTFSTLLLGPTAYIGSPVTSFDIGTNVADNIEIGVFANRTGELHIGDGATAGGQIRIGTGASASNNVNILNGNNSTGTIQLGSSTSITNLNCPLTPNYTYTNLNYYPPAGTSYYGNTAGAIGYCQVRKGGSTGVYGITNIGALALQVGVWFMTAEYSSDISAINSARGGLALTPNTGSLTGAYVMKNLKFPSLSLVPKQESCISVCAVIQITPVFPATEVTIYAVGTSDAGGFTIKNNYLCAVKLA